MGALTAGVWLTVLMVSSPPTSHHDRQAEQETAACGSAASLSDLLPEGAEVVAEEGGSGTAGDDGHIQRIYLDLPASFVRTGITELWLQRLSYVLTARLIAASPSPSPSDLASSMPNGTRHIRGVVPYTIDPDDVEAGWKPLVVFVPPPPPVPTRDYEKDGLDGSPGPPLVSFGATAQGAVGALTGKVVYVSQAHGFTWNDTLDRWATQRGNTHGIVEDLVNAEGINHYLVHYLRNAGATVFTVREDDMQSEMVIVDAEPGGTTSVDGAGQYEETGTWVDSTAAGFLGGQAPYLNGTNPHTLGGTRYATATTSGVADAVSSWTPTIPKDGYYGVYVSYAASANRVPDAHYVVAHAGGETHVRVNQQRHGNTWIKIGTYWFKAGENAGSGAVSLLNDTEFGTDQQVVSADAVRFGGGMGQMQRNGTGAGPEDAPTSLMPRWRECSRYYSQFMGAPTSVYDAGSSTDASDDVGNRSRTAAWHNELGEDAVYIAWHTNAPDPGRGTSTFVYGPNPPNGSFNFTGVAGSDQLATLLQDEIVGDIRAAYDPSWKDRGVYSAYFGEVNPNNNSEMPAALVEAAFHSTAADADYLEEPRFRQLVSRAFAQAVVKYFAQRDGIAPVLTPEPPVRLRVTNGVGAGAVTVSWDPPFTDAVDLVGGAATGYRVYMSLDGRGFDNGTEVVGGATSLDVSGLQTGTPVFFRVTATNDGGQSFPTPTIAAVVSCNGAPAESLAVMGFVRLDSQLLPRDEASPWGLGTLTALRASEVNTYDYLVEHAWAFATAGLALDGAEATAVEDGMLSLNGYETLVWSLGEESTVDETFSDAEQAVVTAWAAAGDGTRTLIASGSEVLWDLVEKGETSDVAFATNILGVAFGGDDAGTYVVAGIGAWAGLPPITVSDGSDGQYGSYNAEFLDILTPLAGGQALLEYGTGGTAATWFAGANHRTLLMGFPFEAVRPTTARAALANAIVELAELAVIGVCTPPTPDQGPETEPDSAPETTDGSGTEVVESVEAVEAGPDVTSEVAPEAAPDMAESMPDAGGTDTVQADVAGDSEGAASVQAFQTASRLIPTVVDSEGCAAPRSGGVPDAGLVLLLAGGLLWLRRRRVFGRSV